MDAWEVGIIAAADTCHERAHAENAEGGVRRGLKFEWLWPKPAAPQARVK